MSELPSGWAADELGSFLTVHYGKALASSSRASEGGIPVIGSSGQVGNHDNALVQGPCLVIGRKGAAGAVHLIQESCWPIDTAYFIQPPSEIDLNFLHYFLSSQPLGQLDKSTAIPSLSRDDLYRVSIPVAPRPEQTRIVEKLESLLADLDAGVAELKAAQRKLTRYRQSLLKAAVEGALTADWRAANAPQEDGTHLLQRILRERRTRFEQKHGNKKKYPEPAPPDTAPLPVLPEGWTWATIDQLSLVVRGASPRPAGDPRFFGGDIPWITVGSLTADETMYLDSVQLFVTPAGRDASRYIEPNTLLLTNSGATLGVPKITRIGGCINDGSVALLDVEQPLQTYLYWFLRTQTKRLRATNQGAAQPNLNTDIVRNICVPLCGLAEMSCINEMLQKSVEAMDAQEHAIAHGL